MATIKNLIFDLGDVLLDLNFPEADRRFRALLGSDFLPAYQKSRGLFQQYEVGQLADGDFLSGLRENSGKPLSDEQLLDSWNAILAGVPPARLRLLESLRRDYRLFLLRNTNSLHMEWLDRHLARDHGLGLQEFAAQYFERFYLSYEIGLNKPNPAIFRYVLEDAGITAEETLFIDDNRDNIESAAALGIQVLHHDPRTDITEILPQRLTNHKP